MLISDIALKRPVGAIVLSLTIILLGVVGYNFLGVRLYPAIDPPVITVQTSYTGANPEIIESQITEPLEKSINGIEGVKSITSQSSIGTSRITVEFNLGSDLEKAANDVRDKVSQAQRNLPLDISAPPTVTKADANSDPIIMLVVQSSVMNSIQLSEYAENIIAEQLQTIKGVSSVAIYGQQRPAMRIWLDPDKLNSYNLTVADVNNALNKENIEKPSGKIRGDKTELTIKTYGRLETEEDFNSMIISQSADRLIRLRDVGYAILGPEVEESGAKINGKSGIVLAVIGLPGANTIEIADEFYSRLDKLKADAPKDMKMIIGRDKSEFVRNSVKDVLETLLIAIALVVSIIFLFFRSWTIALRPLLDIPVSLIGTFFVMYIFGFSINVLTLLGIVLATGLVVDDGIVVTENIFKKIEKGMSRWDASVQGTREIFFAVVSTSLTLAIVFIPVVFLEGFTGRLFREFGIVVSSAILISAIVSLTLTPVLNLYLGRSNIHDSRFYQSTEPFFVGIENLYKKTLSFSIRNKWLSILIVAACLFVIVFFFKTLKKELAPLEDQSFIRTFITLPEGTEFGTTKQFIDELAQVNMDSVQESKYILARYGAMGSESPNSGFIITFLRNPKDRKADQQKIYDRLSNIYKKISYGRVIPSQEPTISTSFSRGLPIQFVIQNIDFEKIKKILPKFMEAAKNSPVFSNTDIDLKFNKPELNVYVDRLKATSMGVSEKDIADAINAAFSGGRTGYFLRANKQYYIITQFDLKDRNSPDKISTLHVRSNTGQLVRLDNLITMKENSSPPVLFHFNRYKSATISGNPAQGKTLGDGIDEMRRISDNLLDGSFTTALSGPSRDFEESSGNISFALILALLLIFLILAAQFESFIDPFIIMVTVPMAIAGALLSLWIFGQTLNIFSEIGILLLIGIVTKNGILIVEFANQKRRTGIGKIEAAFDASVSRFRPILMTSIATIFGALPIALALGEGSGSRIPLGIVIVGGLLFSLILTLFVIPVIYIFLSSKKKIEYNEEF